MSFSENLVMLRKSRGMSQEQLAEALEVSRQTIYKWESAQSYPEMDRLMAISELFGCTMDALAKTDLDAAMMAERESYEVFMNRFSIAIGLGVFLILAGIAGMLAFPAGFLDAYPWLGLSVFLLPLTVSVGLFLYFGMQFEDMVREVPPEADYYLPEEKKAFRAQFRIAMVVGVALIFLSILFLAFCAPLIEQTKATWPVSVMLLCIGISTFLFVYFGLQGEKYEMKHVRQAHRKEGLGDKIASALMLLAVVIYLIGGFFRGTWGTAWVVFPIFAILGAVIKLFFPEA